MKSTNTGSQGTIMLPGFFASFAVNSDLGIPLVQSDMRHFYGNMSEPRCQPPGFLLLWVGSIEVLGSDGSPIHSPSSLHSSCSHRTLSVSTEEISVTASKCCALPQDSKTLLASDRSAFSVSFFFFHSMCVLWHLIAGSDDSSIFNVLRKPHVDFHGACNSLRPH